VKPEAKTPRRSILPNGLRVVSVRRPESPLAALKLFFKVGSRHDGPHPGIAHFLEHLLFSNSKAHRREGVGQAVEATGGQVNAVTTREYTALQAVVLAPYAEMIVQLFADLLDAGPFDPALVERERQIILEEIGLNADSYQIIWDLFLEALWDGHPLARPVTGTPPSVSALTAADLAAHWTRYLAADRIVLAAAGNVDHDALTRLVAARLGSLKAGPALENDETASMATPRRSAFLDKDTHQTQFVLGVETIGMGDPRRYALRLLDIILGQGASSRLHRVLRTERRLVYDVSSVLMSYADRGYFAVYTACAPRHTETVSAIILDEFDQMRRGGVTGAELAAAKTNYEGSLARNFETVLSVASIIGIEELLHQIEPFDQTVSRIRQVTVEDLQRALEVVVSLDRYAIALVGRRQADA